MGKAIRGLSCLAMATLVSVGVLSGIGGASQESVDQPSIALDELLAIAKVSTPPEGLGLQLNLHWPEENPYSLGGFDVYGLTANVSSEGTVEITNLVTAGATDADDKGPARGECDDKFFKPTGPRWEAQDMPVVWRFRANSMPEGMNRTRAVFALRHAHMVWPRVFTNCDSVDEIDFTYLYDGPSRSDRQIKYDKVNLVDFGSLGGEALAVNYTWYTGLRIVEVDLRFNRTEYRWTNVESAKSAYQLNNVAAHELGHQLGLDDLSEPHNALTMFGRIGTGEMNKTTLGLGDIEGATKITP